MHHEPIGRKKSVNADLFSTPTLGLMEAVGKEADEVFGNVVRELAGSDSIVVNEKVVAKLLPQDPGSGEHVLLGVSSDYRPQEWGLETFEGPYLVIESPFHFVRLPDQIPVAVKHAGRVFRELKSRMGL
ncbi:MAG: hypothetical protein U0791_16475 [Gemmataceae bacterium]